MKVSGLPGCEPGVPAAAAAAAGDSEPKSFVMGRPKEAVLLLFAMEGERRARGRLGVGRGSSIELPMLSRWEREPEGHQRETQTFQRMRHKV